MGIFDNFDLEEFLAYLLPGAAMLMLAGYLIDVSQIAIDFRGAPTVGIYANPFLELLLYFGLALIAGHITSIWNRAVVQPILSCFKGNSSQGIFGKADQYFFSEKYRAMVAEKFRLAFGADIDSPGFNHSAEHLIRAYVFQHSSPAIAMRERIVRTRSLCGNATLPIFLLAICLAYWGYWLGSIACLVLGLLLCAKVHFLSRRDTKHQRRRWASPDQSIKLWLTHSEVCNSRREFL